MVVQKIIQEHTRLLKISGNESCENLLTELADYVIHENLAKQGFTKALLERERNFPTGIQAQTGNCNSPFRTGVHFKTIAYYRPAGQKPSPSALWAEEKTFL